MKAPPFDYHRPQSLDEALRLLAATENARILAGGQSLVSMMNLRYVFPDALIDVNPLRELAKIEVSQDTIGIGALARQRAMEISEDIRRAAPILSDALAFVGHRQTRNRGTLGGSLCHLDPSAELPTIALLYDARTELASVRGRRSLSMRDFIGGYMNPLIEADEMLLGVSWRPWPHEAGHCFLEHARRHGDFAIASCACLIEADEARRCVKRVALAVGGLFDRSIRLDRAEEMLAGRAGDAEAFGDAAATCDDFEAAADIHASAAYRASVAKTLVRRALAQAWARATNRESER